jgi:hypothetical protein
VLARAKVVTVLFVGCMKKAKNGQALVVVMEERGEMCM